jgi:hypothetical protein
VEEEELECDTWEVLDEWVTWEVVTWEVEELDWCETALAKDVPGVTRCRSRVGEPEESSAPECTPAEAMAAWICAWWAAARSCAAASEPVPPDTDATSWWLTAVWLEPSALCATPL